MRTILETLRKTLIPALFLAAVHIAAASPPALSLSKAAKLADDALAKRRLPPDFFLHSVILVEEDGAESYYRVAYAPEAKDGSEEASKPSLSGIQVMRVSMDGKVSLIIEPSRVPVPLRLRRNP